MFHENIFPYQALPSLDSTLVPCDLPQPTVMTDEPFDYTQVDPHEPTAHPTSLGPSTNSTQDNTQRISNRVRRPPSYLQDYHCTLVASTVVPTLSSSKGTSFIMNITTTAEPTRYSEAVQHDCWRKAIVRS